MKKKHCFKIFFKTKEAKKKIFFFSVKCQDLDFLTLEFFFSFFSLEKDFKTMFFFQNLNFFFFSKSNSENSESAELNFHFYMIFNVCRTTSEEEKKKFFVT